MNKRQIKQLLSDKLQSRIEEELLKKKGSNKKVKGKKQSVKLTSAKKYADQLASMITVELLQSIEQHIVSDLTIKSSDRIRFVRDLEKELVNRGVKFEGNDIQSTELTKIDFSAATLSWSSNKVAVEGQFQFPVMGTSFVINPDFGDLDERTGKFVHTITFKYSRPQEALTVLGLDTVFKGA